MTYKNKNGYHMNCKLTFLLALTCLPMAAQKRAFTIRDIYRVKTAYAPTVARDGRMVYTLSSSNLKEQKSASDIFTADGKAVTNDGASYAPQWSPDGKTLYYTSSRSGLPQLWRHGSDGTDEQVTDYKLGINGAVVSPDGRSTTPTAQRMRRRGRQRARTLSRHTSPTVSSTATGRNTATDATGISSSTTH